MFSALESVNSPTLDNDMGSDAIGRIASCSNDSDCSKIVNHTVPRVDLEERKFIGCQGNNTFCHRHMVEHI